MLGLVAPPSMLQGLPDGVAGTRATLKAMARLVKTFKKDPTINLLALEITRGLPSYDSMGEIKRLQNFVRDRIRYVMDVDGVETLRTPLVTLEYEAGDCDDKSVLLCTLLATIGYACQFIAVGFDGESFSHVMAAAKLGTRCIPCETIVPNVGPGWFPNGANPILPWNI
jgi:transglutaminase-like putative cysteine protease